MEWLKEAIRPYYLRWLYFPLRPQSRPQAFQDCWRFPFDRLGQRSPLPESPSPLPTLLFYPMTDWHTRIQRTQHLIRALAGLGYRCLFLNPHLGREFDTTRLFDHSHRLTRLEPGIYELHVRLPREPVFHERLLSAPEEDIIHDAIRKTLPAGQRDAGLIQILSFPLWHGIAHCLRQEIAAPVIYDCHDLLSGFHNISSDLVATEEDLLETADLVLFSSQGLSERYAHVKRSLLVRNAVTASQFENAGLSRQDCQPVAGYVGALDSWFHVEALEEAARQNPQCRFVVAGRIEFDPIRRLRELPNIELVGEIPYQRVPETLARFRVGLIPFHINPLTLMTNPIKLYEYFSCGMPVVTTPLPEAQSMGELVYVGSTPGEFARQVSRALAEEDSPRRARRREIAERENWTTRARSISAEFPSLLDRLTVSPIPGDPLSDQYQY